MNNYMFSQTDSSQIQKRQELLTMPHFLQRLYADADPQSVALLIKNFASAFKKATEEQFLEGLKVIAALLEKGYALEVGKAIEIPNTMMKKFNQLCCARDKDQKAQIKMIFVLSTIAELIKQSQKVKFPFTRKFLQSVFLIDEELLEGCSYRKSILAVLGVIYENASRQAKLLKKLDLVGDFKASVLTNYHIVEQSFSARLFNITLYNLAVQGESLTQAELHKYGVFESIARFMGAEQSRILIEKLKTSLARLNAKSSQTPVKPAISNGDC